MKPDSDPFVIEGIRYLGHHVTEQSIRGFFLFKFQSVWPEIHKIHFFRSAEMIFRALPKPV